MRLNPIPARGQALDRARLGEAGQALDQHVAIGQQRDHQPLDHTLLADDRGVDPVLDFLDLLARRHRCTPASQLRRHRNNCRPGDAGLAARQGTAVVDHRVACRR